MSQELGTCKPLNAGKLPNEDLQREVGNLSIDVCAAAIEMVASYGMAVGREVFETCVWIGRFAETIRTGSGGTLFADLVDRRDVKLHHCHSAKAKDANVRQALIDRFGDKGTKSNPGWFYGFKADVWQAMALAVYVADTLEAS
jgi:hypothetical protein